ncbi:MAG: helix-turn-helix transcriptional regulator [Clostridia bacterium]|nr:helix-turn-helix transcriptional regulator [Clostridia bacterium]
MRTWDDYKEHVKSIDKQSKKDMEATEELAAIVSAIIEKRNSMGLSQRDLADLCGIPQSSVARIETYKTTPNLNTLIKMMAPLGLKLVVSVI